MSDWYRNGRDDGRGYGEAGRRRESSGRDRWSERNGYGTERRSFEEDPYGARGGGYGDQGWAGGEGGEAAAWRAERARRYGGRDDEGERQAYGQRGRGIGLGANPEVARVADGDFEPSWRERLGGGEHRGKGPKGYSRSDERIKEDVSDRLADDSWLDAREIEVVVVEGEVTLSGTVDSRQAKRRAEDIAEDVSGVKHVQCNLRVNTAQTSRDQLAGGQTTGLASGRATQGRA